MADPVSWLMVEPGWDVVGRDDEKIGQVEEVLGDTTNDIFSGLLVSAGLFKGSRYVPAEHVSGIYEGRVVLDLDADAFEGLHEHAPGTPVA